MTTDPTDAQRFGASRSPRQPVPDKEETTSTSQPPFLRHHRISVAVAAAIAWFAASTVLRLWPRDPVAVTVVLILTLGSFGALVAFAYDVTVQLLVVRRSVAAVFVVAAFGLLAAGEPIFALTATQSFTTALRTILPLHTPGFINVIGNALFLGVLVGIPSWQYQLRLKTNRRWDAVDDIIVRWVPRMSVGMLLLITLLYHYWHGPLAHTPLSELAIGSLFAAALMPPVLRPIVRCTVTDGPDSLIRRAPRKWLSTALREISREAQAVKIVNWSDTLATLSTTMQEFDEPDAPTRRKALKKDRLRVWRNVQRNAYRHQRLKRWQIAKLEAVPGWTWGDHQPKHSHRPRRSFRERHGTLG